MCKETECNRCEYAKDLKGCTTKHIGKARMLLSDGEVKEAGQQLGYVERHLEEE